jgi:hypothetical protein
MKIWWLATIAVFISTLAGAPAAAQHAKPSKDIARHGDAAAQLKQDMRKL